MQVRDRVPQSRGRVVAGCKRAVCVCVCEKQLAAHSCALEKGLIRFEWKGRKDRKWAGCAGSGEWITRCGRRLQC